MTTSMGSVQPPSSLSYTGAVVVPFITRTFSPQTTFNTFSVPTIWINTAVSMAWILVSKEQGVAVWAPIGGSPGEIDTITTPDSVVVVPTAGNINFLNGSGMNITGSGSNITFNTAADVATLYTADSGIAVPSSGNLNILGGSTGLTTTGLGNTISLTGTLNVAHGGTSQASLTNHSVLLGAGTSAVNFAGPNASTHAIFVAQGASADPAFSTTSIPYVSGVSFDAGSNTLANYSVGTFMPVLSFGGGTTGITYTDQDGTFTRIGNILFFTLIITLSSKGSSTGAAKIAGFPLPPTIETNVQVASYAVITLSAGYTDISMRISGATTFDIQQIGSGLGVGTIDDTNFANNSQIKYQGFYTV